MSALDRYGVARFTNDMAKNEPAADRLEELTTRRSDARIAADEADMYWRWEIARQIKAGRSVTEIAAVAGITRARVYQIRDGRR